MANETKKCSIILSRKKSQLTSECFIFGEWMFFMVIISRLKPTTLIPNHGQSLFFFNLFSSFFNTKNTNRVVKLTQILGLANFVFSAHITMVNFHPQSREQLSSSFTKMKKGGDYVKSQIQNPETFVFILGCFVRLYY